MKTFEEIEILVLQAIDSILNNELSHELGRFLIVNILEQIQLFQNCGVNVNDPALQEEGRRISGGYLPGGQCMAGACGKKVAANFKNNLPPIMRSQMGEKGMNHYLSKVTGFIQIFSCNIAQGIFIAQDKCAITEEDIKREVTLNIAHEYRHAFQSEELVNLSVIGFADKKKYDSQPHEEDANIFAIGVAKGWCKLADAPTWQPSQEQREKALKIWEKIQVGMSEVYEHK